MPVWRLVPPRLTPEGGDSLLRTAVPRLAVQHPATTTSSVYTIYHGLGHKHVKVEVRDDLGQLVDLHWECPDDDHVYVETLALFNGTINILP